MTLFKSHVRFQYCGMERFIVGSKDTDGKLRELFSFGFFLSIMLISSQDYMG